MRVEIIENIHRNERLGEEKNNYQGCIMKIIEYNSSSDIVIEFQDKHKTKRKTNYGNFKKGAVRNPYVINTYGIGISGDKYPLKTKEHQAWVDMIYRTTEKFQKDNPTYKNVRCCKEWIYYENFYEWICMQENYDKWLINSNWCLDKDILCKNNKIYEPSKCCLVPTNVNTLFVKKNKNRGELPIGVMKNHDNFMALCSNPIVQNNKIYLGTYKTSKEAFMVYKIYKEYIVQQVAQIEFDKNNISTECYNAMMKYEVEITD